MKSWIHQVLVVFLVSAIDQGWTQKCSNRDIGFELITGYVFTAPEFILDTSPGVLLLEECLLLCHRNTSCFSINYETGLCVLFTSSAEVNPESLTSSQFPVFTLYAQKVCVPGAKSNCPGRAWIFDRVQDFRMTGFARRTRLTETREECMSLCLATTSFPCRSATYDRRSRECVLSDMDRLTTSSVTAFLPSIGTDYMESNCVTEPVSVCNFKQVPGKILKTVDSVFAGISSRDDCRQLCVDASFRCHSYDYGDTGKNICRLSHHSSSTLRHIKEPYLLANGANTYELGSCYNVTVECQSSQMIAKVSTNRVFRGKMYGKTRPNSCNVNVRDSLNFELVLGYNDINCDVKQDLPGRFSTDVIIQHHDMIVTSSDVGLKIRCNYNLENKTVSNAASLAVEGGLNEAGAESAIVRSPNVTLRVTDRLGLDITSAKVGDPLALRFEIAEAFSPYEIFVRELIAMDGQDSSEILLIDSLGCPTDYSIMGVLQSVNSSAQVLQADFDAFKFPTSDIVQFRALVTPCIPRCDPVRCDVTDYYGRRQNLRSFGKRKRKRRSVDDDPEDQDLMVAGLIRISDKFELEGEEEKEEGEMSFHCDSSSFVISIGATVFLLAQCCLMAGWTYLIHKRRRCDDKTPPGLPPAAAATAASPNTCLRDYDPYFGHFGANQSSIMRKQCHNRRSSSIEEFQFSDSSLTSVEPRSM